MELNAEQRRRVAVLNKLATELIEQNVKAVHVGMRRDMPVFQVQVRDIGSPLLTEDEIPAMYEFAANIVGQMGMDFSKFIGTV